MVLTPRRLPSILFLAAACGGTVASTHDGTDASHGEDVTTRDAGTPELGSPIGSLVPGCPSSPAATGTSCDSVAGVTCEYGNDPDWACNSVSYCSPPETCTSEADCAKFSWQPLATDSAQCPSPPLGDGPGCPATHSGAAAGGACTKSGLVCSYAEGLCACSGGQWACAQPEPGCPPLRPRIGSPCPNPSLSCDYSVCPGVPEDFVFVCSGPAVNAKVSGFWTAGLPSCGGGG